MEENLTLYNAVREVPDSAKRSFSNGRFNGTEINPMWRIKTLTEQFGPAGVGWYYEVLSERQETLGDEVMAVVDLNLYVRINGEWSKPIYGTGGNMLRSIVKGSPKNSDEGYKMALTDALSVACKALGVGADVYFEKDHTKYTDNRNERQEAPANRSAQQKAAQGGAQAGKPEAQGPRPAEPIQLSYLEKNCSEDQYLLLLQKYGGNLERLTYDVANRLIAKLKGGN